MKPRNKAEKRVFELSSTLPKITANQKQFARTNSLNYYGVVSRNKIYCFECNIRILFIRKKQLQESYVETDSKGIFTDFPHNFFLNTYSKVNTLKPFLNRNNTR